MFKSIKKYEKMGKHYEADAKLLESKLNITWNLVVYLVFDSQIVNPL